MKVHERFGRIKGGGTHGDLLGGTAREIWINELARISFGCRWLQITGAPSDE
jgi:hypothetical protein